MNKKENMIPRGWVYCLSNPSFPNLLKIGQTRTNPHQRATQLYTTGVPTPFKVEMAKYVPDYEKKEKTIHRVLEKFSVRVNSKREFFEIKLEAVKEVFDLLDGEDYTKELIETAKKDSDLRLNNYLIDGQKIRHVSQDKYLECFYDIKTDKLKIGDNSYTPVEISRIHHSRLKEKSKPFMISDFQVEVDGNWMSLQNIF